MKGLILAGGKGTRLRPFTYSSAKQLFPVANKPILFYAIDKLRAHGVEDIGIVISPETGEEVKAAVSSTYGGITFILQDRPLGLAHAVKQARSFLEDSPFILYLGDNLLEASLDVLTTVRGTCILLKEVENPEEFGVVELENGKIKSIQEKPRDPKSNLALVGIYLFSPEIHKAIDRISPSRRGELEITDAIKEYKAMGYPLNYKVVDGWWLDTGKSADVLKANEMVLKSLPPQKRKRNVSRFSNLGEGTIIKKSIIGKNVSIGKNCQIVGSILENCIVKDNTVIENFSLEDSIVGSNSVLMGYGVQDYFGDQIHLSVIIGDDSYIGEP